MIHQINKDKEINPKESQSTILPPAVLYDKVETIPILPEPARVPEGLKKATVRNEGGIKKEKRG